MLIERAVDPSVLMTIQNGWVDYSHGAESLLWKHHVSLDLHIRHHIQVAQGVVDHGVVECSNAGFAIG